MRALAVLRGRKSCGPRRSHTGQLASRMRRWAAAILALIALAPAIAQETTTYTYDGRGRVVSANHGSGPSAGLGTTYRYDAADNRTGVTVAPIGTATAITLGPASLPNGTVGTVYSTTSVVASGGTGTGYTYQMSGTIPGLTLSSSGSLSGTPTSSGTFNVTVIATDSGGNTGSKGYAVTIGNGGAVVSITTASLPNATTGTNYSQQIYATGGTTPYTFSYTGTLPPGLTFSSGGLLSGKPTTAGNYTFTVTVRDNSGGTATHNYTVTVRTACSGVDFRIVDSPPYVINEGQSASFTVSKTGTTIDTCSVHYQTLDDTAKAGINYTAKSGTISFASTDTSKSFTVNTLDDGVVSNAQLYFDVKLSSPTGAATISQDLTNSAGIQNIDTNSNGAPVAGSDSYTLQCNTAHDEFVFSNDSDPEGDPLTLISATAVTSDFTISIANAQTGDVYITTHSNTGSFNGQYVVTDGHGNNTTGSISISVIHGGPGFC